MITVNELRKGNLIHWITDDVNKIIEVVGISEDEINFKIPPIEFNPIPLTKHWLLKLGFEYAPEFLGFIIQGMTLIEHKEGWVDFVEPTNFKPLKSVHQLQNLYFALTGEELKAA